MTCRRILIILSTIVSTSLPVFGQAGCAAVWQEYTNDNFGFALRHPQDWHASVSTGTSPSVIIGKVHHGTDPQESMQFFLQRNQNPKKLPVRAWAEEQLKKLKSKPDALTDTTIGGQPAVLMENHGSIGKYYNWYVASNKTDILTVSVIEDAGAAQMRPLYDLILSTIRFLPSKN